MPHPRTPSHILVVDDDPLIVEFITAVLSADGHAVTQAASGEAALDIMLSNEPDLALLDINMPGMGGLELARHLHEEGSVPFMFISSNKDNDIVAQAVAYGAVGYLVKPVNMDTLVPAVKAGLARAQEIRQLRQTGAGLSSALAASRETSIAVGLLMAKYRTDRNTAFEVLRDFARSHRRKIHEVANELLMAEEVVNRFNGLFAKRSD